MKVIALTILVFLSLAYPALACDPCALYNASRLQGHSAGTFTLSLSEQYTSFDRAQDVPENSVPDGEFVRGFSTTQVALVYDATENLGLQATLPVLGRRLDRIENYRADTQTDGDIGDASLVGTYSFLQRREADWAMIAGLTAGVKFPTGDTGVLEDTVAEDHSVEQLGLRHHTISSASGGRALAFGSGSYDYILGINFLTRYERYLLLSNAQYTLRTEGDFDYEFADDFLWTIGSGYYFLLNHDFTLAGLIALSGEFKGKDHLKDELVVGSEVSNLYVGPQIISTWGDHLGAELALDFRVTGEDRGAYVVPETRLRAGISYRFS